MTAVKTHKIERAVCTACDRRVTGRRVKDRGNLYFDRHDCIHGRRCIGGSVHRDHVTHATRNLYCRHCAWLHLDVESRVL